MHPVQIFIDGLPQRVWVHPKDVQGFRSDRVSINDNTRDLVLVLHGGAEIVCPHHVREKDINAVVANISELLWPTPEPQPPCPPPPGEES